MKYRELPAGLSGTMQNQARTDAPGDTNEAQAVPVTFAVEFDVLKTCATAMALLGEDDGAVERVIDYLTRRFQG